MREENQLKIICKIIEQYRLNEPLSRYLKDFFKTHPQMGSRDRRLASHFTYSYFRLGKALNDLRMIERIAVAGFLCSKESNPLLAYCLDKFSLLKEEDLSRNLAEKLAQIKSHYPDFNSEKIFPFSKYLSDSIDRKKYTESFLLQPKLWIRTRNNFRNEVLAELSEKNISFEADEKNPNSIALVNATSLEKTKSFINGYFETQDWASQQTIDFIEPMPDEAWWDACSGSGGKALMMFDEEPTIHVLATDKRPSILKNLEERFQKAGIKNFQTLQLDLSQPLTSTQSSIFNLQSSILCDVPCTGSGTWARSPEWLTMFREDSLAQFVTLQRNIITNLTTSMKTGMPLVYITCSVFKEENEMNVQWMESHTPLSLQKSGYIEGYEKGADTMYAARFIMQ